MDSNNMYNQGNQGAEPGQFQQPPYQQPYNQGYQPQFQQPYQQPPYQGDSELEEPVTFGDWMLSLLILSIPCVNIIMMFVWAFSSNTKKSKSNYFKAVLVWSLIWTVISVIIIIGFGTAMAALISEAPYYY